MIKNIMSQKTQIIGGIHAVRTAIKHPDSQIQQIWVDNKRHDKRLFELLQSLKKTTIQLNKTNKEALDKLAPKLRHQGILAEVTLPAAKDESSLENLLINLKKPALLLILDGITDPHNLGACLRSADGAGVDAVIAPKDRASGLTPVACKVASGAAESVPFIQVTNLARTLKDLRQNYGIWTIGTADETSKTIYQADLAVPMALIMGSEEKGLRRLTREQCDELVSIPMQGMVESLNVSVATGICLFEVNRQRYA